MDHAVNDRIFWIYFIIVLAFIVIGVSSIITSTNSYVFAIVILWTLTNIALLIIVYHASIISVKADCCNSNNWSWLLINALFIIMLVISTLWASELNNPDSSTLRSMSGILLILGGLLLYAIIQSQIENKYVDIIKYGSMISLWACVIYLLIWFCLTMYVLMP